MKHKVNYILLIVAHISVTLVYELFHDHTLLVLSQMTFACVFREGLRSPFMLYRQLNELHM